MEIEGLSNAELWEVLSELCKVLQGLPEGKGKVIMFWRGMCREVLAEIDKRLEQDF